MTDFLKLSKEAFDSSSAFLDANYRADMDYSVRAFRNEHAAGSKYLSPEYASRSRLFRPKTRSIIRKNEAAGSVALFSNMEIVDLQPGNPDDQFSVDSRDAMKAVLEYRLQNTIPTFEICMGGIQDAQTQGVVVSYQYWEYQVKNGRKIKDKPCIELRPVENIRLDGGASWLDPVNSSPYFCDIIPMYVCQVRGMMESVDDKTGAPKWKKLDEKTILRAKPDVMDSIRKSRLGKQQDPHEETTGIKDFDIVWVMRWFMKDQIDDDYTYYTLGTEELLTDPQPLEEVYFHGIRPYVMGYSILETHKVIKTSMPMLVKPLQQETNAIGNDRIDNVKFVLHKRWFVARGRQVDVSSLVRGVPGGVTLTTDPKTDVQESNWPDVTSSAYVEQDRLNAEFDDLAGNFSPNTKFANKGTNDTLGGARLASQGAGLMTDYLLRTIIETWWEKVLRQLVKLEAAYETDEKILAICAKKAKLFPRYGQIPEEMLNDDVTLTVNVGMGATNPDMRLQKFMLVNQEADRIVMQSPPGANIQERLKELYSHAGYRDGSRFYSSNQDPRLVKAMQMIQQLTQQLNGKGMELQAQAQIEQQKMLSNERVKSAEIEVNAQRIDGDLRVRQAELVLEQQRIELERLKLQIEARGENQESQKVLEDMQKKVEDASRDLELERERIELLKEREKQKLEAEIDDAVAQVQRIADNFIAKTTAMYEVERAKAKAAQVSAENASEKKKADDGKAEIAKMQQQMVELVKAIKDAISAKKRGNVIREGDKIVAVEVGA